jgi:RHS repeat-associated protein
MSPPRLWAVASAFLGFLACHRAPSDELVQAIPRASILALKLNPGDYQGQICIEGIQCTTGVSITVPLEAGTYWVSAPGSKNVANTTSYLGSFDVGPTGMFTPGDGLGASLHLNTANPTAPELVAKLARVEVAFNGYGGPIGWTAVGALTPSSGHIPLLIERRYGLFGFGSREIISGDNSFSSAGYGVVVHETSVELDADTAEHFTASADAIGPKITAVVADISIDFNGYAGTLVWSTNQSATAGATPVRLMVGRAYSLYSFDSRAIGSDELTFSPGVYGIVVNSSAAASPIGAVSLQGQFTDSFTASGRMLIAKTAQVTVTPPSGSAQSLCAANLSCSTPPAPLQLNLITGRRYLLQGTAERFTVPASGPCTPSMQDVYATPVTIQCTSDVQHPPLRIDPASYPGPICIEGVACVSGGGMSFDLAPGHYWLTAPDTKDAAGSALLGGITVGPQRSILPDPGLETHFMVELADSLLTARVARVKVNFNGYHGYLGWTALGSITPGGDYIPMLIERRYGLYGHGSRRIGSEDIYYSSNEYGVTVHDNGLTLDQETATHFRWAPTALGLELKAIVAPIAIDFKGYPGSAVWSTNESVNPASPVVSLIVGRRYGLYSFESRASGSDDLNFSSRPHGITVSTTAETTPANAVELDLETAKSFGVSTTERLLEARNVGVTITVSRPNGTNEYHQPLCLANLPCASPDVPLTMPLIRGRRYTLQNAGMMFPVPDATGSCAPVILPLGDGYQAQVDFMCNGFVPVRVQRFVAGVPLPIQNWPVDVYREGTPVSTVVTNQNGDAPVLLPGDGPFRFHTQWGGAQFWSSDNYDCSPTSCQNRTITVTGVDVSVVTPGYVAYPTPVQVNAYSGPPSWSTWAGSGTTVGLSALVGLPPGTYRFRTVIDGKTYSSAEDCTVVGGTVGGCTMAMIKVGDECFDVEEDGSVSCNGTDLCNPGLCQGQVCVTSPVDPDDGDTCTIDGCDPEGGVTHIPDLSPETEGVACEGSSGPEPKKTCQSGVCKPNLAPYSAKPREPDKADEPVPGQEFFGKLKGELSVGPSGAAIYTLPIAIPPGIAGMAPNLSLVYNSQGGNGIAGHGWDLAGLSMIYRCPKTRVQDGIARAVGQSTLVGWLDGDRDGVCLDGKRLKEGPSNTFYMEDDQLTKVSVIGTRPLTDGFKVVTKTGEIRYYGSIDQTRVAIPRGSASTSPGTAIWMLDKVSDAWGNYFELQYNWKQGHITDGDDRPAFLDAGILLTKILYTGHSTTPVVAPFHTLEFTYESRESQGTDLRDDDVRHIRLASVSIPKKQRLKTIKTPLGEYRLTYLPPDPTRMQGTRLSEVEFCVGTECLKSGTFGWEGGGYGWAASEAFKLPSPARLDRPAPGKSYGTQFVDLNGDGRLDLVHSRAGLPTNQQKVWKNTGTKFEPAPESWTLPGRLVKNDGTPGSWRLADLDGDGIVDMIGPTSGGENPNCEGLGGPGGGDPYFRCIHPPPTIWLNRIKQENGWVNVVFEVDNDVSAFWGSQNGFDFTNAKIHMMADMDGDGRADLIRFGELASQDMWVFLNKPSTSPGKAGRWQKSSINYELRSYNPGSVTGFPIGTVATCDLRDVNRDGLPDAVCPTLTGLNTGGVAGHKPWISATADVASSNDDGPPEARYVGDIDGDGLYDYLRLHNVTMTPNCGELGCEPQYFEPTQFRTINWATGSGYRASSLAQPYLTALSNLTQQLNPFVTIPGSPSPLSPPFTQPLSPHNAVLVEHVFSVADLNADGLVDFVLNHEYEGRTSGQLLVNTGTTWRDLTGATTRRASGGAVNIAVPAVPADNLPYGYPGDSTLASAFIDLDGNGVPDLVRTRADSNDQVTSEAWLNTFKPPVITHFPNGLAQKTEISYAAITEPAGAAIYEDDPAWRPTGTTYLAVPLRVAYRKVADDGTGQAPTSNTTTTTYHYASLRGSAAGRGPQGFHSMTVYEDDPFYKGMQNPELITTTTVYAQGYPYTGMATSVKKERGGLTLSLTGTTYCDTIASGEGIPPCSDPEGSADPGREALFVYPMRVIDMTSVYGSVAGQPSSPQYIQTTTNFRYDSQGNLLETSVEMAKLGTNAETYLKKTVNWYDGTNEAKWGKPTKSVVTSQRTFPTAGPPIVKTTEFEYESKSAVDAVDALAMTKKIVERGLGKPIELHTAYGYDAFGNVTTTVACQYSFPACDVYAQNPMGSSDPPFRRTTTSYNPAEFNAPQVPGLESMLTYGPGRFPVKITNALGHSEYFAYDPVKGVPLQQTDANGLHTRFEYDQFGNRRVETLRYGTTNSLRTTTNQYYPNGFGDFAIVAVTKPPSGADVWTYRDVFGRTKEVRTRSFSGDWVQSDATTFDSLGRTVTQTKPRLLTGGLLYLTTYQYDRIGRLEKVTQDLGQIDGPGTPAITDETFTTFQGTTVSTKRTVKGVVQKRDERKNVLGKVVSVLDLDATGARNEIKYAYDAEGNLTETTDPSGNKVTIDYAIDNLNYEKRGWKRRTTDPDMGQWTYTYNGFGDLVAQTDAKGQEITMTYDALGRMTGKTEPGGKKAEWVYDKVDVSTGQGRGKLSAMVGAPDPALNNPCTIADVSLTDGNRAGRSYKYNALGELEETTECVDGVTFKTNYSYELGRQATVTYPDVNGTRLKVRYHYTKAGYLHYVTDEADNLVLWKAKDVNALGQVTAEQTRNGVETTATRNGATGWLMTSFSQAHADDDKVIQDWSYGYDQAGNLRRRDRSDQVNVANSKETFEYDPLNRLTSSRVKITALSNYDQTESFDYDRLGNLTAKGGKLYSYSGCSAGPHAVCTVGGGALFGYDANGNMTSSNGRTVTYNAANKVRHIEGNGTTVDFAYGADGNRVVQVVGGSSAAERTLYVGLGATGKSLYERTKRGSTYEHVHFLYAGGAHGGSAFALKVVTTQEGSSATTAALKYYHFDHLGSVTAMSDDVGRVQSAAAGGEAPADVIGYDPWGARRKPDGRAASPGESFAPQVGRREFTGHETITGVGLVNMNGRVYDPLVGRFLSPDPNIQFVADLQSYNRYSYALNNPLRNTDPTGYFISSEFDMLVNTAIGIASAVVCTGAAPGCAVAFAIVATYYNATSALAAGASVDQVIGSHLIGMAGGMVGGAVGESFGQTVMAQIIGGAIGGAASAHISTVVYGGNLGENVLRGAAMGALWAGVRATVRSAVVSQALDGEGSILAMRGDIGTLFATDFEPTDGRTTTAPIGGVDFVIDGGSAMERAHVEVELRTILRTPQGEAGILTALRNRLDANGRVKDFRIHLTKWTASSAARNGNYINLNRGLHTTLFKGRGMDWMSVGRVLAHEFGHAAMGLGDDAPTMMNTVNFENMVMRQALPLAWDRQAYVGAYVDRTWIRSCTKPGYCL